MTRIGFIPEPTGRESEYSVEDLYFLQIFRASAQTSTYVTFECLQHTAFIFVKRIVSPESSEVVAVANHGDAPFPMQEATRR